jgi:flagellar hook-length control protein FliK
VPADASTGDSNAVTATTASSGPTVVAAVPAPADAASTIDTTVTAAANAASDTSGNPPGAAMQGIGMAAVAPAAVAAPAAASGTQAVSMTANVGAADKHARSAPGDASAPGAADGAAGLTSLSATPATATDVASTPTLKVAARVDSPEFGQALGERVSWMVDKNLNGAKLQVNPPQLGPIEVRISLQGDHAQVWLTSHSAVTRDALESSSPKLREMLGAQGFGQVSVDISQRSFQERTAHSQPYEWAPAVNRNPAAAIASGGHPSTRAPNGAVDAYA